MAETFEEGERPANVIEAAGADFSGEFKPLYSLTGFGPVYGPVEFGRPEEYIDPATGTTEPEPQQIIETFEDSEQGQGSPQEDVYELEAFFKPEGQQVDQTNNAPGTPPDYTDEQEKELSGTQNESDQFKPITVPPQKYEEFLIDGPRKTPFNRSIGETLENIKRSRHIPDKRNLNIIERIYRTKEFGELKKFGG